MCWIFRWGAYAHFRVTTMLTLKKESSHRQLSYIYGLFSYNWTHFSREAGEKSQIIQQCGRERWAGCANPSLSRQHHAGWESRQAGCVCVCVLVMWKLKGGRSSSGRVWWELAGRLWMWHLGSRHPWWVARPPPRLTMVWPNARVLSMAQDVASDIAKDRKTFWA